MSHIGKNSMQQKLKYEIKKIIDDLSKEPDFSIVHERVRRYAEESFYSDELYYKTDFIHGYLLCASDHFLDDKTSLRLSEYIEKIEKLRNVFLINKVDSK